ncbi:hypothetical protein BDQ17DRAFT_1251172 [Cyathus striatus]|nr:hypothetical protein BDQ17DRAFT_1251172 [Cyathus striatus]
MWFHSRQAILISEAFNFMKNLNVLIHLMLAIACCPLSNLGFDPSITQTIEEG